MRLDVVGVLSQPRVPRVKTKLLILTLALLGTFLTVIPSVSASHSAPPQLSVEAVGGNDLEFTFTISPEDTPGAPTFDYHLWRGIFIPTDEGDVSAMTGYTVNGAEISFSYNDGFPQLDRYYISSDDGSDVVNSCYVEIHSDDVGTFDNCNQSVGISAFVKDVQAGTGTDTVEFRFTFSSQDPNQVLGNLTYALWFSSGGTDYELFSDVSALVGYQEGYGIGAFPAYFGGAPLTTNEFFMVATAPDNSTIQSCRIGLDTTDNYSFTACGAMESDWVTKYCIPRQPTTQEPGFDYLHNVDINEGLDAFSFNRGQLIYGEASDLDPREQSLAAINMPADTRSLRYVYTIEAESEGVASRFNFFYSTKPGLAGPAGSPDKETDMPVTGAFSDGYGAFLFEDGNDWNLKLYRNQDGIGEILRDIAVIGSDPNSPTDGYFEVDAREGIITFVMDSNTYIADLDDESPQPGSTSSFWLREHGGSVLLLVEAETLVYYDTSVNNCWLSPTQQLFGSLGEFSAGPPLSSLPGFVGEGGYLDEPAFPGLNLNQTATILGLDVAVLGFILAGILVLVCVIGFGPIVGGGIGAVIAAGTATALGLIPAWLLVIIFLGLAAALVLSNRQGSGV